jgi:dipeptidyl aminopeptidase/acylaminoacyl peptidase
LYAVRFDLPRLAVVGGATPVVEGVRRAVDAAVNTGAMQFGVSTTGSLVYLPGALTTGDQRVLVEVDPERRQVTPLKLPGAPYVAPRYAPDGTRVAFQVDVGTQSSISIYDRSAATAPRRLTLSGHNRFPVWSRDSQRVAYQSDREGDLGMFWQRADGTGEVERLTKPDPAMAHIPDSWSPDGHTLLFEVLKERRFSLWTLSLPDRKIERFGTDESDLAINAVFAPNGRWVAYNTRRPGGPRVNVEAFPRRGAPYEITNSIAASPFWAPDGKALFYASGPNQFSAVTFTTQPSVEFGNPAPVFQGGLTALRFASPRNWDLAPDGKRILGTLDANYGTQQTTATPTIQVVLGWFEELKARVPVK